MKKTHDIENMSVAELKASKNAIIAELQASPAELAARYVQARLDAKMRDEKLAQQGKYITQLEQTLAALEEKYAETIKPRG